MHTCSACGLLVVLRNSCTCLFCDHVNLIDPSVDGKMRCDAFEASHTNRATQVLESADVRCSHHDLRHPLAQPSTRSPLSVPSSSSTSVQPSADHVHQSRHPEEASRNGRGSARNVDAPADEGSSLRAQGGDEKWFSEDSGQRAQGAQEGVRQEGQPPQLLPREWPGVRGQLDHPEDVQPRRDEHHSEVSTDRVRYGGLRQIRGHDVCGSFGSSSFILPVDPEDPERVRLATLAVGPPEQMANFCGCCRADQQSTASCTDSFKDDSEPPASSSRPSLDSDVQCGNPRCGRGAPPCDEGVGRCAGQDREAQPGAGGARTPDAGESSPWETSTRGLDVMEAEDEALHACVVQSCHSLPSRVRD